MMNASYFGDAFTFSLILLKKQWYFDDMTKISGYFATHRLSTKLLLFSYRGTSICYCAMLLTRIKNSGYFSVHLIEF